MSALYKWHEVYKAALLETDWSQMENRIRTAESAIDERKLELGRDGGGTSEENDAIAGALRSLNVLRTEATSWSARQSKSEEAS